MTHRYMMMCGTDHEQVYCSNNDVCSDAMFWKGVEVLGPSNTNKDVLYEGPKTTTQQRWQSAFEWMKERNADKSK